MARRKKVDTWTFRDFEARTSAPSGHFVRIATDMIESPAWVELSVYEIALYLLIKNKYYVNHMGDNSKNISFTYAENEKLKLMDKARFTKAIDKLMEAGFIDIVRSGQHTRQATIYALSARWRDYGTAGFKKQSRPKAKRPYSKRKDVA